MIYAYVICINEKISCHVCMRYIQLKLAIVQSETLIIQYPKSSKINLGLGSPLEQ